ncbi:MAG: hypothetical protein ACLPV8_18940 [Steroidobacteraceae bacterium]
MSMTMITALKNCMAPDTRMTQDIRMTQDTRMAPGTRTRYHPTA